MIEVDDENRQAHLRDLASLNGCFINNVRLKGQRERLQHGDNVRFGFDTRVWTVDVLSAQQQAASPRQRAAGGWDFSKDGASAVQPRRGAACCPRSCRAARPATRLFRRLDPAAAAPADGVDYGDDLVAALHGERG